MAVTHATDSGTGKPDKAVCRDIFGRTARVWRGMDGRLFATPMTPETQVSGPAQSSVVASPVVVVSADSPSVLQTLMVTFGAVHGATPTFEPTAGVPRTCRH